MEYDNKISLCDIVQILYLIYLLTIDKILAKIMSIKRKGGDMVNLKFKTVSELRQQATQIVAEVERTGKQVIITKNGKPVVVIQRVTEDELSFDKPKKK